jgi:hypothetical protein
MTKANDLASLLDANGDVVSTALDNVPASNDASALSTGTLPDGRFPTTLPAVSGANLTGIPTPTLTSLGIDNHNQVTVASGGAVSATSFAGDGSSLTNLPASTDASTLTTGTLAAARLPSTGLDASALSTGTLAAARIADASLPSAKLSTSPISISRASVTLLSGFNTSPSATRIAHTDMSSYTNSNTIALICGFYFQFNGGNTSHGYCNGYWIQESQPSSTYATSFGASHYDWYYNVYEVQLIVPWNGGASNQYLDTYTTSTHFSSASNTYSFIFRGRIDRG